MTFEDPTFRSDGIYEYKLNTLGYVALVGENVSKAKIILFQVFKVGDSLVLLVVLCKVV